MKRKNYVWSLKGKRVEPVADHSNCYGEHECCYPEIDYDHESYGRCYLTEDIDKLRLLLIEDMGRIQAGSTDHYKYTTIWKDIVNLINKRFGYEKEKD